HSPRLLKLKRQRRKTFFVIIFSISALFIFLIAGLAYLSRLEQLRITEIRINGNKVVEREMIAEAVQSEISGNYLWLFSKRNIFIYPKRGMKARLQEEFKRFKSVNLSIVENQALKVEVAEREALYTWCGTDLVVGLPSGNPTTKKEVCYFLDENGYIFSEAPYISGEVYFKFYGPIDGSDSSPIGSYVLKGNFHRLIEFKNTLHNMGLKAVALHTKDNQELRMYLSKGGASSLGPEIIFSIDADFENLAENLETALTTPPLLSNFKNKYSSLEYIDLRFDNKVYYRFR
ncbi:hypothetical protein HYZ82_00695, partial [Candidatus Nomurabacteria bacterium]|nr:hypothetical protein [Candidatus Nomurabacteria bacterium]